MNRACVYVAVLLSLISLGSVARADTRTATLEWTIPGDDGYVGRASLYDIRFSRSPITSANFMLATRLNTALIPGTPGSKEHLTVVGLTPGVGYFFALRALDDGSHWSLVSNIAYLPASVAGVEGNFLTTDFSAPRPNPARTGTSFGVELSRPEWLRVEAFDVAGRKVRCLAMGQYSAGKFDLHWDLRNDLGQSVDAGAYVVRSQIGDAVVLRRVMVVH